MALKVIEKYFVAVQDSKCQTQTGHVTFVYSRVIVHPKNNIYLHQWLLFM